MYANRICVFNLNFMKTEKGESFSFLYQIFENILNFLLSLKHKNTIEIKLKC